MYLLELLRKILGSDKLGISNESSRLAWLEKTLLTMPSNARILDAGAGELAQKKFCDHLRYVSQDFAQYNGEGDGVGLQMGSWDQSKLDIISDITAIPEPDSSFDVVMCVEVFEHLPDPRASVKEFSRLLKKDGYLIITAPFASLTHFAPYHFYSGFNRYFYENVLNEYKFSIIEITPNGNYPEYLAQEVRRAREVAEKYSSIRMNILEHWGKEIFLSFLARANKADKDSNKLLCFGYHILAQKK